MSTRRSSVLVLVAALCSLGAGSARTQNFVVKASTQQVAQEIAQAAERYRKEKALLWLGKEMTPWSQPCPIEVTVTAGGSGGATTFAFDGGRVLSQQMHIEGTLERLLSSVLPHEVTHTVFAYHYRQPLPRWADEGGAVLSEDEIERDRHDKLCRQILNTKNRAIPLRRLFALREYPSDVMCLYAQGYSVANFLVGQSSRPAFLNFVAMGMQPGQGWDKAVQTHYKFRNVEELEQAWLSHMSNTRRPPQEPLLAKNTNPPAARSNDQVVVRTTVPPIQPTLAPPSPVMRGQDEAAPERGLDWSRGRPAYLPDYHSKPPHTTSSPTAPSAWQPSAAPQVRLGMPQFDPLPAPLWPK